MKFLELRLNRALAVDDEEIHRRIDSQGRETERERERERGRVRLEHSRRIKLIFQYVINIMSLSDNAHYVHKNTRRTCASR